MKEKEEYDVLRLIEHNKICYISSECQKGCILARWLKYHPLIDKKEMFEIISSIVKQIGQIHRCPGNSCYQYVNPYSIIVSEDRKIYFLDMNAKGNINHLRIVQRRTIREHFLPPGEPYYQKASVELDIYGLGKTIQYLLSGAETEPSLTKSEEIKFQKIISRCLNRHSKKSFHNVSEIQKKIPQYKQSGRKKGRVKKTGLAIITGIMLSGVLVYGIEFENVKEEPEKNVEKTEQQMSDQDEKLNLELGRIYFLEFENYEKSKEYFARVKQNKLAVNMSVISECLVNNSQVYKLREALEKVENEILLMEGSSEEKAEYYQCILRGYCVLSEESDAENVIRIGEICLQDENVNRKSEIMGVVAAAYESLGKVEEAGMMYKEQIEYEEAVESKEEIYKKAATVYEQAGNIEESLELYRKGIEEFGHSEELRTGYIRTLLKEPDIERKICIQIVKEQLEECPELEEVTEFQKLMKEYGLKVKGEKVWEEE
ncbi:MAG: hypothetical protein ACI4S2_03260 [Lachnospiraceae bacterium]